MQRLADISIDLDGEEFVFRVRPGERLKAALRRMSLFTTSNEEAKSNIAPAPAAPDQPSLDLFDVPPAPAPVDRHDTPERRARDLIIARYYAAGASFSECKTKFGCNAARISRALDRTGTPSRAQGVNLKRSGQSNSQTAAPAQTPIIPRDSSAVSQPDQLPGERADERTGERPDNKSNAPYARANADVAAEIAHRYADVAAEIAHRYVVDIEGLVSLAACFTGGDRKAIAKILESQGVKVRSRGEAQRALWARKAENQGAPPIEPKPKPLAIPADAARVEVPLTEFKRSEPAEKKNRSQALQDAKAVGHKIRQHGARTKGMSIEEQQAAVSQFFKEGKAITVIKTPAVDQVKRPAVGMSDGRKGRGAA